MSIVCLVAIAFLYYQYSYLPAKHLKEGWVTSKSWDCPEDHPVKANLRSNIYHAPYSQYYNQTNARNSKCFDIIEHAEAQGFRAPRR